MGDGMASESLDHTAALGPEALQALVAHPGPWTAFWPLY